MNRFRDRIAPLAVAAAVLGYLGYDLFAHGEALTALHLWAFVVVAALVLAPFAARIKIPNVIELETKMDKLREETDRELSELRNAIATVTNVRVNPVMNQYTVVSSEAQLKEVAKAFKAAGRRDDVVAEGTGIESERARFIRQTGHLLDNALMVLEQARVIQIAYEEKREFNARDLGGDVRRLERTKFLIQCMEQGSLEYFVAKEEQSTIIKDLQMLRNLTVMYPDVHDRKAKPPSPEETDNMAQSVARVIELIAAGVAVWAGRAVLAQRKLADAISYLKRGEMPPG